MFDEILTHPDGRRWLPQAAGALGLEPAVLADYKRLLAAADLRDDLPGITVPALVLAGARDTYTEPALGRDLQRRLRGAAYHEFAEAGHFPMLTCAGEFTRVVTDFLKNPFAAMR